MNTATTNFFEIIDLTNVDDTPRVKPPRVSEPLPKFHVLIDLTEIPEPITQPPSPIYTPHYVLSESAHLETPVHTLNPLWVDAGHMRPPRIRPYEEEEGSGKGGRGLGKRRRCHKEMTRQAKKYVRMASRGEFDLDTWDEIRDEHGGQMVWSDESDYEDLSDGECTDDDDN